MPGRIITTPLAPFQGVAVSQTATVQLAIGRTIHRIILDPTNLTLAEITGIRLYANGQEIQRYRSGTELDTINLFDQIATAASGAADIDRGLIIPLNRSRLRRRAAEELSGIGTGVQNDPNPISILTLEVDIAAGAAGVTLGGIVVESAKSKSALIKLVRQFTYSPGGAGIFEISDLPRSGLINRVMFTMSANAITNIQVLRNNFTVYNRDITMSEAIQNANSYRTVQATFDMLDFSEDGFGSQALETAKVADLRFRLAVSGAATLNILVEYLAPLGR